MNNGPTPSGRWQQWRNETMNTYVALALGVCFYATLQLLMGGGI